MLLSTCIWPRLIVTDLGDTSASGSELSIQQLLDIDSVNLK